ncbi:MAG: hypothetical protein MJZ81_01105 [Bacteroidales bacterium]|nr:hypothetical protein [Bacteroidales bacterium]
MSKAGQGQTLIDVALERSGRASEAWNLAVELGVSLTDLIEGSEAGTGCEVRNRSVVKRYAQGQTHPATELTEGIGGWRIGDFIIS